MNIFELISQDINHCLSSQSFIIHHSWCSLIIQLQSFQRTSQQSLGHVLSSAFNSWQSITAQSPVFTKMLKQYYKSNDISIEGFLKQFIKTKIQPQIQVVNNSNLSVSIKIFHIISLIHKLFLPHLKFAQLIDTEAFFIIKFLKESIQKCLILCQFPHNFQLVISNAFSNHCLAVFESDIVDFDENIKQYIVQACQTNNSIYIQEYELKLLLCQINQMGLLQLYFQPIKLFFIKVCERFLLQNSSLQSSSKFLNNTINYCRIFQKSFLKKIASQQICEHIFEWANQIEESIYFLCAKFCSQNILQIVLDYPDSNGVILVLKKCLDKSNLLAQLAEQLYLGVKKRLLIPGVVTQNILNQYLNMLKVLQIIDPHGIVFDKITIPIKNYLLKRNDTLRCIISHMTENGEISTGLTRDMVRIPSKQYIDEQSSDQNENAAEQWQVLNFKETKMRIRVKYQQIDLATVLVNLYGSQQAFITEYQNMLAQKLMSAKAYNIEEEIKNIEILKMRFGQNALQNCNVIVKDVKDSIKNDVKIHRQKQNNLCSSNLFKLFQMNCLAVSKGYWPINYESSPSFQLPSQIKYVFQQYAKSFGELKVMRKIHFHNSLGHVNLTLSFQNGDFNFKCLPIHAVIINYFDQSMLKDCVSGISSQQLCANLKIQSSVLKQKMSFWVHKGVIREVRQTKTGLSIKRLNSIEEVELVYYRPVDHYQPAPQDEMEDDVEQFISKQNTPMESHLKHIIQGLILSILSTNGPKSPQKIHLLLKTVYKTDLDYAYSENHTIQILKKMVQKKKISFNGETYSKISK